MKKRTPTQADVAKAAGVSQATVSLILNPDSKENGAISDATRTRVFQAIRELGYVVNPAARSLAGGRNRLLGVFVNGAAFPLEKDSFYHPILIGIEEACIRHDYDMLLFTRSENGEGTRSIYRSGVNHLRMADGSVLLGIENQAELDKLCAEGYPFVFVGKRVVPGREISYVAADYAAGTATLTEKLVKLGHRRFCFLFRHHNDATGQRLEGLHHALDQYGLELPQERVFHAGTEEAAEGFCAEMLRSGVTAVITEDPGLAHQAATEASGLGKKAPDHYSLASISDASWSQVPAEFKRWVTSLVIPTRTLGEEAVRLLCERLDDPEKGPERLYIPVAFNNGRSIGPIEA